MIACYQGQVFESYLTLMGLEMRRPQPHNAIADRGSTLHSTPPKGVPPTKAQPQESSVAGGR